MSSEQTALMVAVLLDRDPEIAAIIKLHISESRLIALFDLKPPMLPAPSFFAVAELD